MNEDYGDTVPSRPHDGLQGTLKQSVSGAVDLTGEGTHVLIIVLLHHLTYILKLNHDVTLTRAIGKVT